LELDPTAKLAPLDPEVYRRMLARSLLFLGRPTEADRWLEPLLETKPTGAPDIEASWLASRSALQQGQFDRARAELVKSGTYRSENPLVPEPSPYAGSARCTACHGDICNSHAQARHSRTFHHGAALLALPRPEGPLADPDHPKVTHNLVEDGKKLKMKTKVDDRIFETVVDYAFGTKDRYLTMVGRDSEQRYRALRRSYYREGAKSGWGRTAGDTGHTDSVETVRGQLIDVRDGVVRCLYCHVTNSREFRDPDKDGPGPETADAGIGCERCHGPAVNHIKAVEGEFPDMAVVNAGRGDAETVTQQCRDCHIVGDASDIEHSRENPIWVRSAGATTTFSRCYTESNGGLSCLTCHDPHADSERSASFYEKKCLACHSPRDKTAPPSTAAKPVVCKVNPTGECLPCHMPKVPMPVLHTSLTDHYIRVHREEKP
jgi:hypothetical protein